MAIKSGFFRILYGDFSKSKQLATRRLECVLQTPVCGGVEEERVGTRVEERSCFSYRKNLTKKDLPLKHQQQQYHRHHQHRQARPTFFGEFSSSQPHHIRSYLVCANKYFLYIVARKESAHAFLVD